jgi:DTW domain-containing protein YfiP
MMTSAANDTPATDSVAEPLAVGSASTDSVDCARCGKPAVLCVCAGIEPLAVKTRVLILQHPQEQDRALGTARLTALRLDNAVLKIGLSWPSLSKALGRTVDPQQWAVLYLGSAKAAELAPGQEIVLLNKKGEAEAHQGAALRDLEGIILLDGTWSQAKALWWRNAWMLKCRRLILGPLKPSRYGKLRREPRKDGLSTIESAAMVLSRLERRPEVEVALMETFEKLLEKYRTAKKITPGFDRTNGPSKGERFRRAQAMRKRRKNA